MCHSEQFINESIGVLDRACVADKLCECHRDRSVLMFGFRCK